MDDFSALFALEAIGFVDPTDCVALYCRCWRERRGADHCSQRDERLQHQDSPEHVECRTASRDQRREADKPKDLKAALGVEIESVWFTETQDVVLRTVDGVFSGAIAKGMPPAGAKDWLAHVWKPKAGESRWIRNSSRWAHAQAILGVDLARRLGVFDGDDVYVIPPETLLLPKGEVPKYEKVTVKGIISTQMPEIDGKLFVYNSENTLLGWWKEAASVEPGFEVRLRDPTVPIDREPSENGGMECPKLA